MNRWLNLFTEIIFGVSERMIKMLNLLLTKNKSKIWHVGE
jgi:hypothetical protein